MEYQPSLGRLMEYNTLYVRLGDVDGYFLDPENLQETARCLREPDKSRQLWPSPRWQWGIPQLEGGPTTPAAGRAVIDTGRLGCDIVCRAVTGRGLAARAHSGLMDAAKSM